MDAYDAGEEGVKQLLENVCVSLLLEVSAGKRKTSTTGSSAIRSSGARLPGARASQE